jgi:hypothetical protein
MRAVDLAVGDGDGMQIGRINEAEQRAKGDDGGRQVGDPDERAISGGARYQCDERGERGRNRVGADHDARGGVRLIGHECRRSAWVDGM